MYLSNSAGRVGAPTTSPTELAACDAPRSGKPRAVRGWPLKYHPSQCMTSAISGSPLRRRGSMRTGRGACGTRSPTVGPAPLPVWPVRLLAGARAYIKFLTFCCQRRDSAASSRALSSFHLAGPTPTCGVNHRATQTRGSGLGTSPPRRSDAPVPRTFAHLTTTPLRVHSASASCRRHLRFLMPPGAPTTIAPARTSKCTPRCDLDTVTTDDDSSRQDRLRSQTGSLSCGRAEHKPRPGDDVVRGELRDDSGPWSVVQRGSLGKNEQGRGGTSGRWKGAITGRGARGW